jgi:pimeloyl-ACP methyl ester carboxylesterase
MKKVLLVFAGSAVLLLLLASAAFAQNYKHGGAASASPTATASATASPTATATATASATASPSATATAPDSGKSKDFAGLVDIGGGREMYMECQGTGYPTVVFVAGAQDRAETWSTTKDPSEQAVLPAIAETNRVCAYDRPGTILPTGDDPEDFKPSRSDPVDQPTTLQDHVDELHALLQASGEGKRPYVVVGHSMGGAVSRLYASEYPEEVSGLVLVDPTPYEAANLITAKQWRLWKPLLGGRPPEEALKIYPALEWAPSDRNRELASAAAPLKPMPFIAFQSDKPFDFLPFMEDGTLPMTAEEAEQFRILLYNAWHDAIGALVSQVPGAKFIDDPHSGHYIHQEQPQLVIDSIREVVDAARVGSTTLVDTGGSPMVPAVILAASLALFISSFAVMRFVLRRNAS